MRSIFASLGLALVAWVCSSCGTQVYLNKWEPSQVALPRGTVLHVRAEARGPLRYELRRAFEQQIAADSYYRLHGDAGCADIRLHRVEVEMRQPSEDDKYHKRPYPVRVNLTADVISNYQRIYRRECSQYVGFRRAPKAFEQKILFFGIGNKNADYRAEDILFSDGLCRFFAVTPNGVLSVRIPTEGLHNVYNALSAIAVGQTLGLTTEQIKEGLLNFKNAPLRQNIYDLNGMTVIEDCYNASPDSVAAAINVLRAKNGRKIAVLGDMLELGERSEELHEMTGSKLLGADILIAYGSFAENYKKGAEKAGLSSEKIFTCKTTDEAAQIVKSISQKGDVLLFKASRGMHAEEIIAQLKN